VTSRPIADSPVQIAPPALSSPPPLGYSGGMVFCLRVSFLSLLSLLLCLLCGLLSGCFLGKGAAAEEVAREDLFTLGIGRLEDQIDLYDLEGDRGNRGAGLAMREGFLYLADGNGGKVARYSPYGDLLFMIYNDETNPPPLTLRSDPEAEMPVTRWAFTYPLREPGKIAVDSHKHIWVSDRLPPGRYAVDDESGARLDRVVLHFDGDGRFVEYLGREGLGGSPFPHIAGLYINAEDELAIVCQVPGGWTVYWCAPEGTVLYQFHLKNEELPVPPDRMPVYPSVDGVAVGQEGRRLFIKIDYYRDLYDESTNTRLGNEPDSSVIWVVNVEDGAWVQTMEVPFFEHTVIENNRRQTERLFYSLVGVAREGRVFLSVPTEEGYSFIVLSPGSGEPQRSFTTFSIQVGSGELEFNLFCLSPEGILSALLASGWEAKMVWWRTDRFVPSLPPISISIH